MLDKTYREIISTLFIRSKGNGEANDPRTEVLVAMVLDLLMEVHALRSALLASELGSGGKASIYGKAYRDAAYLTHFNAGPSSGLEKLLAEFYSCSEDRQGKGREARTWRESVFMRRIGFTENEIRVYKEEAEKAEAFT